MITPETVVALALRHEHVMERLAGALTNDLVLANPFHRRCAQFAEGFLAKYRKLPEGGDWEMWLQTLETGMIRDGTKEQLGRLLAIDVSGFQPEYFVEAALPILKDGAAQVARARLNELGPVSVETFENVIEKLRGVDAMPLRRKTLFPSFGEVKRGEHPNLLKGDGAEEAAEELIPRLAWRGRHALLVALPKIGKSTLVGAGVAAMTKGGPFLGEGTVCGRVLWLAMDESEGDAFPRLMDNGALVHNVVVMNPSAPAVYLKSILADPLNHPDLIVVDSLNEYTRRSAREMPASGDSAAWSQVMRPLSQFAHDYNLAVVTIHHAAKATGKYRDSTEIAAAVDGIITMRTSSTDPLVRLMEVEGRRSITSRTTTYAVRLVEERVQKHLPHETRIVTRQSFELAGDANGEDEDRTLTRQPEPDVSVQLETYIREHPGASQQALLEAVGGDRNEAHRKLKALTKAGVVREVKRGKGLGYFPATSGSPESEQAESAAD